MTRSTMTATNPVTIFLLTDVPVADLPVHHLVPARELDPDAVDEQLGVEPQMGAYALDGAARPGRGRQFTRRSKTTASP